eukprot:CAMPEP_0173143820 /NCGR_PEP_ID=MMETSP1105-20130129/6885_1 /TAXON_ID=2985 /ORGANISM="Ochromonas sp., Strain BG-1" /LENGTH=451 /DNA_ID=CAMNT_0014057423 /DNA_START=522 /DNA_END=1873 /DNA_ORIENTATION=+
MRADSPKKWMMKNLLGGMALLPIFLNGPLPARSDDELAKFAAEGNKVGVDGTCFFRKCALETASCGNDPSCLKGLSCLARCKGGSMCSTGCFAKYGSPRLDAILHCSVEKHDCVQVPGKEVMGWNVDTMKDLPSAPLNKFEVATLKGKWYKIMGLDSRYDCFDCQKNTFEVKDKNTLKMEAYFRIPRPTDPGYLQTKINEELHRVDPSTTPIPTTTAMTTTNAMQNNLFTSSKSHSDPDLPIQPHLQSKGEMFGLTFWENWYVLAESKPFSPPSVFNLGIQLASAKGNKEHDGLNGALSEVPSSSLPELKLIYYTGHTLQGSYKGAFLYSRTKEMTPGLMTAAREVISAAGLNPNDFCMIRNQCFLTNEKNQEIMAKDPLASSAFSKSLLASSTSSSTPQLISSNENDDALVKDVTSKLKIKFPFWYLGQKFFYVTTSMAKELADWFEDPA